MHRLTTARPATQPSTPQPASVRRSQLSALATTLLTVFAFTVVVGEERFKRNPEENRIDGATNDYAASRVAFLSIVCLDHGLQQMHDICTALDSSLTYEKLVQRFYDHSRGVLDI